MITASVWIYDGVLLLDARLQARLGPRVAAELGKDHLVLHKADGPPTSIPLLDVVNGGVRLPSKYLERLGVRGAALMEVVETGPRVSVRWPHATYGVVMSDGFMELPPPAAGELGDHLIMTIGLSGGVEIWAVADWDGHIDRIIGAADMPERDQRAARVFFLGNSMEVEREIAGWLEIPSFLATRAQLPEHGHATLIKRHDCYELRPDWLVRG